MKGQASRSVSAARMLVGVIAGVVMSFVLAALISQHIERSVADRVGDIVSNAMPSIHMLSAMRGDLRQLENDLETYPDATPTERSAIRDRLTTTRADIGADFETYAALPFFSGEPPLYSRARDDLATLDTNVASYLAHPDATSLQSVRHDIDTFDRSLQRMISFDAAQGQRLGLEIERIRGQTRATTVLLDATSVVLAIVAAILAVRQLRRAGRTREAEQRAAERHAAELVVQNEALGQFAGRVAHDILSPLSTASLAFDLVRETSDLDPPAQRGLDRGKAAIARVHTLVDGLLAFSRAGGQPEPGASTELAPVIGDIVIDLETQARQQEIALHVDSIPDGSIACSAGVLTSVLTNLVRNAIKYMGRVDERRIDVRVRELPNRWRFEVEDTGPGIPENQQGRIFEPYVQLEHGAQGIGLGLATVDRLVRAHGGTVGVTSPGASGVGSLFWFELPKRIAVERASTPDPTARPS